MKPKVLGQLNQLAANFRLTTAHCRQETRKTAIKSPQDFHIWFHKKHYPLFLVDFHRWSVRDSKTQRNIYVSNNVRLSNKHVQLKVGSILYHIRELESSFFENNWKSRFYTIRRSRTVEFLLLLRSSRFNCYSLKVNLLL